MFAPLCSRQRTNFENPERPDSVLNLLKENGFTRTQISKIVKVQPLFLLSDPEKTLLPKIEFFRSVGVSSSDLPGILSSNPMLLGRSLKKQLIPSYDFLKSVLLVNEKVLTALKRSPRALQYNVTTNMAPNIALLRQLGVPQSTISFWQVIILLKCSLSILGLLRLSTRLWKWDSIPQNWCLRGNQSVIEDEKNKIRVKVRALSEDDVPQLLNVYQGKMDPLKVGSQSEKVCGA
ncbi:hypothetical protein SLA2020_270110 [Shorea laevis]